MQVMWERMEIPPEQSPPAWDLPPTREEKFDHDLRGHLMAIQMAVRVIRRQAAVQQRVWLLDAILHETDACVETLARYHGRTPTPQAAAAESARAEV